MREKLKEIIEELLSVENLEYHDKNLLAGDDKTRSEYKQRQLRQVLTILEKYQLDTSISSVTMAGGANSTVTRLKDIQATYTQ